MDWPRPRTLLLVDDSPIVRDRLMQLVETLPNLAVIGQCQDADSGLSALVRLLPDVLLLDIRLRGGGGMKLLQHAIQHYPGTTVIVFTNQAEEQTRRICLGHGAHAFLDKSTDFDQLGDLLARVVRHPSNH